MSCLSSGGCRGCSVSFTIFVYRLIITKESQSETLEAQGRNLQDAAGVCPPRGAHNTSQRRFLLGFSDSLQIPGPCEFKKAMGSQQPVATGDTGTGVGMQGELMRGTSRDRVTREGSGAASVPF